MGGGGRGARCHTFVQSVRCDWNRKWSIGICSNINIRKLYRNVGGREEHARVLSQRWTCCQLNGAMHTMQLRAITCGQQISVVVRISLHAFSHFAIFMHFGQHDNHSWSHIPDHLPEISDGFRSGTYTGGRVVKCNIWKSMQKASTINMLLP